jgi:hypothetical protein
MLEEKDLVAIKLLFDQSFAENFKKAFDESFAPAFDKAFAPAFDKAFAPAFDKAFAPAFDKAFAPAFDKALEEKIIPLFDEVYVYINKGFADIQKQFDDIYAFVNEGFTGVQAQLDELKVEMAKRPTRDEIFTWTDRHIIELELAKDRHDYLHINELDKLPSQSEISQALMEKGYKKRVYEADRVRDGGLSEYGFTELKD